MDIKEISGVVKTVERAGFEFVTVLEKEDRIFDFSDKE